MAVKGAGDGGGCVDAPVLLPWGVKITHSRVVNERGGSRETWHDPPGWRVGKMKSSR